MNIEMADRLKHLPPYLFAKIDQMKQEIQAQGIEVLDFGVGDPDLPTPQFIVDALKEGLSHENYHRYAPYAGTLHLRKIISEWFFKRFQVELDPQKEILVLIGSKEGIAHLPLALINSGEKVFYTTPGYPVYKTATQFSGGIPVPVPLTLENQFLPNLSKIKDFGKLFFFNYPNNPTSATAPSSFFEELVQWAKNKNIILCHDAAYSEMTFGKEGSQSLLKVSGAKERTIEFHSLSKTFNMTGWRVGFAVGNSTLISALGKIKTTIDSGQFLAIQHAAGIALQKGDDFIQTQRTTFQRRRSLFIPHLKKCGLEVFPSEATFYVWAKIPSSFNSIDFSQLLLTRLGMVTTPGVGFGKEGEGYIRFSLTLPQMHIQKAIDRLTNFSL